MIAIEIKESKNEDLKEHLEKIIKHAEIVLDCIKDWDCKHDKECPEENNNTNNYSRY